MPYSGVHQTTMGKLESNQSKMINYSADLSFPPDNECVELLWENGQIVMQGQSSRTRKSGFPTNISSQSTKFKERENKDAVIPKIERFGTVDSFMNDFSLSGHAGQVGLVQDDDMGPWLNYPIDDCLQNDYYSELFSELSGVNMTSLSVQNNQVPVDKNGSFSQGFKNTGDVNRGDGSVSNVVGGGSEPTKPRTSQLISTTQQCQSSIPTVRSRVPDFNISSSNNTHQTSFCNSTHTPISMAEKPNAKMKKQHLISPRPTPPQTNNNTSFMNFSHFSRPAALVKANLQSIGASTADRLRSSRKVSVVGSSPVESSLIESTNGSKPVSRFQGKSVVALTKVDLNSSTKPSQEPVSAEQSEAICHEDAFRNNKSLDHVLSQNSSYAASAALGGAENEKSVEPVVASSSVCSGNSAGGVSNNPKHGVKRKNGDVEESEYQSEDVEDESVDVKKPTTGRGTSAKRSRAAEVHNLSERRRRDRINEKMRALQELIPNCNKVDKASMLDEAIEYLKTLQLQVQIMSMGSGLCMPPMMLPAGMQNMHAPHMTHFSPMGVGMGMGMGMGFGMGMLDASCSSGRPLIPVPPMRGAQFPCLPASRTMSLHGMPGSNLQMFGIPGQGLPMSMPHAPFIPLSGFSTGVISVSDVSGAACPAPVPDSAPCSSSKNQIQNTNVHTMHKATGDCSQIQTSTQTTKESIPQSALVQNDNQASRTNSVCRNGLESSGRTT